ncbi:sulfatase-like hydrolase/transferase [Sphingobium sp. TB-6]|nr:sulfatase-like hydrolase/transferase [Sphingobium sp. TB-6]
MTGKAGKKRAVPQLGRLLTSGAPLLLVMKASCLTAQPVASPVPIQPVHAPDFKGKISIYAKDSVADWPVPTKAPANAPNVVIWVLDDVGFGQIGALGGLANTPNIDRVAGRGLIYNNFHATSLCSPTRAALLTGRNHHAVHIGSHAAAPAGFPGYDDIIPKSAATTAKVLSGQGYSTMAIGKWDHTPAQFTSTAGPFDLWPLGQGFDHFYGFMGADSDHFEPNLWQDNSLIPTRPHAKDYYLTTDLADQAINFITGTKSSAPDKPFYLYWATGAVHGPHQSTTSWREMYKGKFDMGWDVAREQIFARQKRLGVVPRDARLPPRSYKIPAWSSLSADQKKMYARQMEAFAAQLSQADHEFGRMLDALERTGQLDNTLIFIVSDNGASAEGGLEGLYREMRFANGQPTTLVDNLEYYDRWGGPATTPHYHAGWAMAGNTPFRYFKQSSHEGGARVPMILSWPKAIKGRGVRSQYGHVVDISPTIFEAAGITPPVQVDGVSQQKIDGVALNYSFVDPKAPERHKIQYYELWGNRGIYAHGWKAVVEHRATPWDFQHNTPFKDDVWHLYGPNDFTEVKDVAATNPAKLEELKALWHREALANNVYPLDDNPSRGRLNNERLWKGTTNFTYYGPGAHGMSDQAFAPLKGNSHRIDAVVDMKQGGQGVIMAVGGSEAGFSLYLKNGKLNYDVNGLSADIYHIESPQVVSPGKSTLSVEFRSTDRGSGTAHLYINNHEVASGNIPVTAISAYSAGAETADVGRDNGSPVSNRYAAPYELNNATIERVDIRLIDN